MVKGCLVGGTEINSLLYSILHNFTGNHKRQNDVFQPINITL